MAEAEGEARAAGAAPEDSQIDHDALVGSLDSLFNPEPDEGEYLREWPHGRLEKHHGLTFDYMNDYRWEGSTTHPNTRLCSGDEAEIVQIIRNMNVSTQLFDAALRLFGDSLIAYHHSRENPTPLRFYPPVVLTFWSAFESFIRYTPSELMLLMSKGIADDIARFLREEAVTVDRKGDLNMLIYFT